MLISLYCSSFRLIEVYVRRWVVKPLKLLLTETVVWREDRFTLDFSKFGHPLPDVITMRIAFLSLYNRIEDLVNDMD